jgi:DNA-binding NtrC family response regulator
MSCGGWRASARVIRRPTSRTKETTVTTDTEAVAVAQAPARQASEDTSIRPFTVHVPEAKLQDLRRRIAATHAWPGNIRELQNIIERAVVLSEGGTLSVHEEWLTRTMPPESSPSGAGDRTLARLHPGREREFIEAALAESRGRVSGPSGAATKLGIPRQTLESKMASLGIERHRFRSA